MYDVMCCYLQCICTCVDRVCIIEYGLCTFIDGYKQFILNNALLYYVSMNSLHEICRIPIHPSNTNRNNKVEEPGCPALRTGTGGFFFREATEIAQMSDV